MARACSENEGKILMRNQIICGSPFSPNIPFVCVHLRNHWHWQELNKMSARTFKKHVGHISNRLVNLMNNQNKTANESNIEIRNCPLPSVNGVWIPTPVGEQIVYVHSTRNNRWLYSVDNNGKNEWWLGTTENKDLKRAWGWLREIKNNEMYVDIWDVSSWKWWNGQTKTWIEVNNIEIIVESKERTIENMVAKQIKTLETAFEHKMNEYENKMKNAENISQEHRQVSKLLFNNLSKEDRLKLIDQSPFRTLFKVEDLCSVCFSSKKTTKCVHADCTGACADCRGENPDAKCCACNREQVLECPICMNEFPPSFINRFDCQHGVCWKCFSQSYVVKKPIIKCPMCRKNI